MCVLLAKHRDLLELLRPHKGRQLALPISAIAGRLGVSEREIKRAVKSLVEDFGLPIGASRQAPYGYFLIVSADDLEFALRPLANEVISIVRRMRKLGGTAFVLELIEWL